MMLGDTVEKIKELKIDPKSSREIECVSHNELVNMSFAFVKVVINHIV